MELTLFAMSGFSLRKLEYLESNLDIFMVLFQSLNSNTFIKRYSRYAVVQEECTFVCEARKEKKCSKSVCQAIDFLSFIILQ